MNGVVLLSLLAALWPANGFTQEPAARRLAVELSSTPAAAMLRISGDGALVGATRRLSDPERLVVELRGVIHSAAGGRSDNGPVARMRVEQRQLAPEPISLVTVDLRRPVELSVEQRPSSIVVTFLPPRSELSARPGAGVPLPRGVLFLSLELSDLSPGTGGERAAIDWVQPTRLGPTWFAGLSTSRLAGTEWNVGRFGAAAKVASKTTLDGEVHLGGGHTGDDRFDYRVIEAGLTHEIVDRRLYLKLKDRYLDIDATRGNLLEAGFTYLPGRRWSTQLTYARSTGGNFDTDYVSGRLDVAAHRRLRLLGGFALGRTRPEIFNVIGEDAVDLEEVFLGIVFPVRGTELTVVLDRLELGGVERGTVSLSLRVPWRRSRGEERTEP